MARQATLWRYCAAVLLLTWAACIVTEGSEAEHEEQAVPMSWAGSEHREGSAGTVCAVAASLVCDTCDTHVLCARSANAGRG